MQTQIELFDQKGRFVMPSAEGIEQMDDAGRERFQEVQETAVECETIAAAIKNKMVEISKAVAERDASDLALNTLRPPVDRVQEAKRFIATHRWG